jgi:hypothetical protein
MIHEKRFTELAGASIKKRYCNYKISVVDSDPQRFWSAGNGSGSSLEIKVFNQFFFLSLLSSKNWIRSPHTRSGLENGLSKNWIRIQ